MGTDAGPQDLIRSYRDRLAVADRQLHESIGDDPLAGHLLAWDAERLASLAASGGAPASEVGRLLRDAALRAEHAVANGSPPSAPQVPHYLALAVIASRRPLAERVGEPVLAAGGTPGIDACLAALVLRPAEEAVRVMAGAGDDDPTGVAAARAVAARDPGGLQRALRARCDGHRHPEDPDDHPLYAQPGGGSLDLVGAALVLLARAAGMHAETRCPWMPLEAARWAGETPPARTAPGDDAPPAD